MTAGPLLLLVGRDLLVFTPGVPAPRRVRLSPGGAHEGSALASSLLALGRGELPRSGIGNSAGVLSSMKGVPVRVGDRPSRALAEAFGLHSSEASAREVAQARRGLPSSEWTPDRAFLLTLAETSLAERLASPEEVVITLSREGDRLDRLLRKEREALAALSSAAGAETPVAAYASRAQDHLRGLEVRHRELERALEETVLRLLPNTSAVLGPRTAGRLLSLAGSGTGLLRLDASRVQVLGARRRRSGSPGPRHGVLYGAEGADRVPPDRRGALARSLASWAVVAIRADLLTHGSVGADLSERREKRIVALGQGRRRPLRREPPREPSSSPGPMGVRPTLLARPRSQPPGPPPRSEPWRPTGPGQDRRPGRRRARR